MSDDQRYYITAPRELADLLAEELGEMGIERRQISRTGVFVECSLESAYRACLWSRIANRVLMPLTEFRAESAEALYEGAFAVDWRDHFDTDDTFAVDANVFSSAIRHSQFAAQKVKDAIADRFREEGNVRPSVDTREPDIRINAYIYRDEVTLYLDLSGDSLHRRGYRTAAGAAPLRENIAAALLRRARWPELASEGRAFVDFMCGSGTLLIEAAEAAFDIAPGLTRPRFGFLKWKHHQPGIWRSLIDEATSRREAGIQNRVLLLGFDRDPRAIDIARDNIERAGLADAITVEAVAIANLDRELPATGLVALNPPYGKRLGGDDNLEPLYREIGELLRRRFLNWNAALLTDDTELGKAVGIRARRIHTLYNGPIKCNLLHFDVEERWFLRAEGQPEPLPPSELSPGAEMFRNRVEKNGRRLRSWLRREDVHCYRLYDADLPEYAVAVDLYADGSGERYLHIQEYEAPASVDRRRARHRLREIVTVLPELLSLDPGHLFVKTRRRQRGDAQYERLAESSEYYQVEEGGARFLVNFEEHLDTGLFLDHRTTRRMLRAECAGKSFLNLFAYTGSATVAAAMGGASRTTSIDLSAKYLAWARENMARNGFNGSSHQFVRADCMAWLREKPRERFDLIFLDPPTFSNSARMETHLDLQSDHARLIDLAITHLREEGKLYFSTNARRFKLDGEVAERYDVTDITRQTIPPDFARRPNIHRCWVITRRTG